MSLVRFSQAEALRQAQLQEAQELENMTGVLTSFDGNMYPYIGAGIRARQQAPIDESKSYRNKRNFTFTIKNGNEQDESFYICSGLLAKIGLMATGTFVGADGLNLTGSAKVSTIEKFRAFVEKNPCVVSTIRISSDVDAIQEQSMQVFQDSPFISGENDKGNHQLSQYKDEKDYNARIVTIKEANLPLDNQTIVKLGVPANSTITVTLFVNDILNTAAALNAGR